MVQTKGYTYAKYYDFKQIDVSLLKQIWEGIVIQFEARLTEVQ